MYTTNRNGQGDNMEEYMSKIMRFSSGPYVYIIVDLDKEEVTEAAYGVPSKYFATAERMDESFEKILDKALESLNRKAVKNLKEFTKNDTKLKESFKRVFLRKIKEAIIYRIKDDE